MALEAAKAANLREPRIVIHAHFQIRIPYAHRSDLEFIREPKHGRVRRQFQRCEIEITVRVDRRYAMRVDRPQIARQPAEPDEIALVKRHQADEAAGLGPPRRPAPLIRNHASTIPCSRELSGPQAPLDASAIEYSARYLFDGAFRRVDHRNPVALEQ